MERCGEEKCQVKAESGGNQLHINPDDWQWEYDSPESNPRLKAKQIFDHVSDQIVLRIRLGAIIQLHDGRQPKENDPWWMHRALPTYLALPVIIEMLRTDGYRFVKLDDSDIELLEHDCAKY